MANPENVELVKQGTKAVNQWRAMNPASQLMLRHANLTGVNLTGADLGGADFVEADLTAANLAEADLCRADLGEAKLNVANLCKADLVCANLNLASLYGGILSGANLGGADLRGANLTEANLTDAHLGQADLSGAILHQANLSNANVTSVKYDRHAMKCLGIRVDSCVGNPVFRRDAMDQDYVEAFRRRSRYHAILYHLWSFFTDCGRSLWRVALLGVALAFLFGLLYDLNPHLLNAEASANTWLTPYYYSVVTFTTLGFGDVTPATLWGEVWVAAEVVTGYLMLGLLVSILANKVARRS